MQTCWLYPAPHHSEGGFWSDPRVRQWQTDSASGSPGAHKHPLSKGVYFTEPTLTREQTEPKAHLTAFHFNVAFE